MRIFLVRHGQTAWNIGGKAQGHRDVPLDEVGLAQAEAVAREFQGLPFSRVIASDLSRSYSTAEPTAKVAKVAVEKIPALRERSFGEWEGSDYRELTRFYAEQERELGLSGFEIRPPGGESFSDLWVRLEPIRIELNKTDGNVLVVSHGGTLSVLLAQLVGGGPTTYRSFRFVNAGITELVRREDGTYMIVRYNDVAHLENRVPSATRP